MEFLGNKTALVPRISDVIRGQVAPGAIIADVFAGTASVSAALRHQGYAIHANDILPLCATWAKARLAPRFPTFEGLVPLLGCLGEDPYGGVVRHLANLTPVDGWVTKHYTPRSRDFESVERRYLTVENGRTVDAARETISSWRQLMTEAEHALLLTTVVDAVAAVSNVAGTYGCYLKTWKSRSLRPIEFVPVRPGEGREDGHRVTCQDAEIAVAESQAALIYADPPYTKRQYAAYYHLLNTIVGDSDPEISGSTGLPRWQQWFSDWCYSRRAPDALDRLVGKSDVDRFLLSYSSDGHIQHSVILEILGTYGEVSFSEVERRRYRSSRLDHRSATVLERLYLVRR